MSGPQLKLLATSGPDAGPFRLEGPRPVTLGRAGDCDVCLLNGAVSRRHASFVLREGAWYVVDNGSRHGTFLNGVRLEAGRPAALDDGDLLRIEPWTFGIAVDDADRPRTLMPAVPVDAGSRVESLSTIHPLARTDARLALLTECLTRLGQAVDEATLADLALDAALEGSGYPRAAILRLSGEADVLEVIATRAAGERRGDAGFRFSRSLVDHALAGEAALLCPGADQSTGRSIAELGIHSALGAPVPVGGTVAAVLYLDARGRELAVRAEAAAFCEAIAHAYGLALANLKRLDLEIRQRAIHASLEAAREVQLMVLPAAEGRHGHVEYASEVRPGLFVAGDLFDVVPIDEARVAFCFGDVAGHGLGPAMLMASAQASLHALLAERGDPSSAARSVNEYLATRMSGGRFLSLWIGVIDRDGRLSYVDAGHGHALLARRGASAESLGRAGAIPLGIRAGEVFAARELRLAPGDRIVLYSDGVTEQRDTGGSEFGLDRVRAAIGADAAPTEDIRTVFDAMIRFAGTNTLDDDATVASIRFTGGVTEE